MKNSSFTFAQRVMQIVLSAFAFSMPLIAAPAMSPHVESSLLAESQTIQPGKPFVVALRLKMEEHWHTYWKNPGDSGEPTSVEWTLPPGFKAGPLQWPTPIQVTLANLVTYGYEGEIALLTEITPPADLAEGSTVSIKAKADWLVCKNECVPGSAEHALDLRVSHETPQTGPTNAAIFAAARRNLPKDGGAAWASQFAISGNDIVLRVKTPGGVAVNPADLYFYSSDENVVEPGEAQKISLVGNDCVIRLKRATVSPAKPEVLEGVLAPKGGFAALDGRALAVSASQVSLTQLGDLRAGAMSAGADAPATFAAAAVLAFIGGLILNLMPCVFPVLGIKILGFVNQSGSDRRKITLHGVVFTVGVLMSFWTLATVIIVLHAAGQQVGWGFQLQSPVFVFGLAVFLLIFALNMAGLFEFGLSATSVGGSLQMASGYTGTFFTGVLATVVSTPCAAPFLAPALGAAFTMPPLQSFSLFTIIALGLSTPYLVLSIFPSLVKKLPRPGAWMETFKQFMAFPLLATVMWLLWVLAGQVSAMAFRDVLLGVVLVAMACWAYGRWVQQGSSKTGRRIFGYVFSIAALAGGLAFAYPQSESIEWQTWSPEAVTKFQQQGKIVYVDFTARWCLTCQANETVVFSSKAVRTAFHDKDVVAVKADWTNRNPEITRALAAFGRSAVPVNLVYRPGSTEPELLPSVLTPGVVLEALDRAATKKSASLAP